jgi:hypothetical protein
VIALAESRVRARRHRSGHVDTADNRKALQDLRRACRGERVLELTLEKDAAMTTSPALNSSTAVSTTVPAMVPLVSEIRNALNVPRVGVTARIYTNRGGRHGIQRASRSNEPG